MSKDLSSFYGNFNGYKLDGRGTWSDNGTHSIRHSVDLMSDGSINEHVVITEKSTGSTTSKSGNYAAGGGCVCPKCGGMRS